MAKEQAEVPLARWEREKKVLALASRGVSQGQIASQVGCSLNTVRRDLKLIYKRVTDMLILDGCAVGGDKAVYARSSRVGPRTQSRRGGCGE